MINLNRRSSHAHHGSNTHTHVDRTHSLTHLHQHSYVHVLPPTHLSFNGFKFFSGILVYDMVCPKPFCAQKYWNDLPKQSQEQQ